MINARRPRIRARSTRIPELQLGPREGVRALEYRRKNGPENRIQLVKLWLILTHITMG
jgi:hypothetical protein